jgi:hypothetical protein
MMGSLGKLFLVIGVAALSWAIRPAGLHAETAVPLFGPESKLLDGYVVAPGGKNVVPYDNSFYMAVMADAADGGGSLIRVARVSASGSPVTGVAVAKPSGVLTNRLSMAVSDGSTPAGRKTVHLIWRQEGEGERGLFYSWAMDDKLDKWSVPVRINGKNAHFNAASIVVSRKGDRHVIFIGDGPKMYYTKAAAGSKNFTAPAEIPGIPNFDDRDVDTALDSEGTLHVAFVAAESPTYEEGKRFGLQYTNLKAAAKKWSAPKVVAPMTALPGKGNIGIAAGGPKNVFIVSSLMNRNLEVYRSTDGGETWSSSTASAGKVDTSPSIAVAADNSVTVGAAFVLTDGESQEARILRSADGVTWSPAAVIPGLFSVTIALDSKGKAAIFARKSDGSDFNYLFREK